MTADKPVVSFIIPVRNDAERLRQCLRSIQANDYPADLLEIVVVNNGSTDDSASVARAHGAVVVDAPRMRLGALRNSGVRSAHGSILALVDADHEIATGWIAAAVEDFRDPMVAAVGAPCWPPSSSTWVQRTYDRLLRRHTEGQQPVEWLGSGNMAVRRSAFDAAGGFDTSLETCEDVDLCRKIRLAGGRILADDRLRNIHYGDPATLRRVFFGELWRGRDNVRVSLRAPRSWRTLVSAAIPAAILATLTIAAAGLLSVTAAGLTTAAVGAAAILLLLAARTMRMKPTAAARDLPAGFAVAAAYEFGRAFALAARATHARRRLDQA